MLYYFVVFSHLNSVYCGRKTRLWEIWNFVGLGFKNKVTAVVFSSSVIGCVLMKAVSGNPQLAALLDLKRRALSMLM